MGHGGFADTETAQINTDFLMYGRIAMRPYDTNDSYP